ncbi:hypothetical protein PIB30_092353 [Stylosanthes scabra]|uniref:Uncharacterized protein n=1 Tax=Stylosanthes scabra TaxID=79078 RepID=A0ABU6XVJ8_9FABA|nr:hypothetical protein [Stylosanthes scabra]
MDDKIPLNNEGATDSSNPQPTLEKEVDQRNQTIQQLGTALRELLERQTREAAIASEAVKKSGRARKETASHPRRGEKKRERQTRKAEQQNTNRNGSQQQNGRIKGPHVETIHCGNKSARKR